METGDQPANIGADSCVPEGDRYVPFHYILQVVFGNCYNIHCLCEIPCLHTCLLLLIFVFC